MINKDRIVPVQKIDLLSLYGTMMSMCEIEYSVLKSDDIEGNYIVTSNGMQLADQPVKSINFDDVSEGQVFFVAAYDYSGMSIDGEIVETTGDSVQPDGVTFYSASLNSGTVTIHAVTPMASNAAEANIGTGEATISTGSGNNGSN